MPDLFNWQKNYFKMKNIILDFGHGGINPNTNKYVTAPDKMYKHSYNEVFYEGVFNREFGGMLYNALQYLGFSVQVVSHEWKDTSLRDRANAANKIYEAFPDSVFISIHSNAGGGDGFEVFTSPGETDADPLAAILGTELMQAFPSIPFRRGNGEIDKEAKFTVLMETKMPAILPENLFFDNYDNYKKLINPDFKRKLVRVYCSAIQKF